MNKCNHVMIISGGTCNNELICRLMKERNIDIVIAVDGGLKAVDELGIIPDYIVGDFDTIESDIIEKYRNLEQNDKEHHLKILTFQPEKDDTDTEIAVRLSIELSPKDVTIVGATGTRLDHTFANIHLLKMFLDARIDAAIYNETNKIYLIDNTLTLQKSQLYGPFFSMLPFTEKVNGITLKGFKYPLNQKDVEFGTSLCISNEVVDESATVSFEQGILIIFETMD